MYIPGSISTNKNFSTTIMNNNLYQQQLLFHNLKNSHSNKVSSTSNFLFDADLLRELNARYLHDMNALSPINKNGFSSFIRSKHFHQHKHEHNLNILTPSKNSLLSSTPVLPLSSSTKKCNKWCTAHVRISWMIYHQQQRLKDKLSLSDNKKDEEQQQSSLNNKLSDLISNTKAIVPLLSNDSSLSTCQTSVLPPPAFNYRSSFDVNNGLFSGIPFSSSNTFDGLGSLFPSTSIPIDRKSDINGSVPPPLNLDWSRFHRNIGSFSSINDNLSSKKLDEINNNHQSRKRSSTVVNDDNDHLIFPSSSHLSNNKCLSSNSSHSPSRKHASFNIKSNLTDNLKSSSHSLSSTFDPLTLSFIERESLSSAYASLFASPLQGNHLFPMNIDPTIFRKNNSSNLFSNFDSSIMSTALIQREHFLNSLRLSQQQQHQHLITGNNNAIQINKTSKINNEETKRIKLNNTISPASNSSNSSLSNKSKQVKHEKQSPSPLSITENHDFISKEESTSSISTTT